jgi:hypothetical protein
MRYPGCDGWRNPDIVWPADQSWVIATDVDFWALYVGGTAEFLREVKAAVPTSAFDVDSSEFLAYEH